MPNNYFRFREFTVYQDRCAMKVCTDACLFGAWTAAHLTGMGLRPDHVLDAGAGTGLLSLMLAQKLPGSSIHAVEIDSAAAGQANDNFRNSPWGSRMHIFNTPLQDYDPGKLRYELVISNPPFYENDLHSSDTSRNLALHSVALDLPRLVECVKEQLLPAGIFAVLLPRRRSAFFEDLAGAGGFSILQKTAVRQSPAHTPFRDMYLLQAAPVVPSAGSITIKEADGSYSPSFHALLKDYYLFSENEPGAE